MSAGIMSDCYPMLLSIGRRSIHVDKRLKVLAKGGLDVIFRFDALRGEKYFTGLATIWEHGRDQERLRFASTIFMTAKNGEKVNIDTFLDFFKHQMSVESFARSFLKHDGASGLKVLLCDEILEAYMMEHRVRVDIVASDLHPYITMSIKFYKNGQMKGGMIAHCFTLHVGLDQTAKLFKVKRKR